MRLAAEKGVAIGAKPVMLMVMKACPLIPIVAAVLLGLAFRIDSAQPSPTARDFAWVEQRVQQLQPEAREKRFDEIGWAKDLRAAERLAKENNRPVFLFTHDGRMNIGRC